MKKRTNFTSVKENSGDERIEQVLNREFEQPDVVEQARQKAFARIREMAGTQSAVSAEGEECHVSKSQQECVNENLEWDSRSKQGDENKSPEWGFRINQDHGNKNLGGESRNRQGDENKNPEGESPIKQEYANQTSECVRKKKKFWTLPKIVGSLAAAAAAFTLVCISDPALAANIPLVGRVFAELGESMMFSGDYSKYAKPLVEETDMLQTGEASERAEAEAETAGAERSLEDTAAHSDNAFSKTVDGVTVTLSEVYCNSESLSISMIVQSEEPFPDTYMDENRQGSLSLNNADMKLSYNPNTLINLGANSYLQGEFMDDRTFAGTWRIRLDTTNTDMGRINQYYEDKEAFLKEKGVDVEKLHTGELSSQEAAAILGLEELTDNEIVSIGGPDYQDYIEEVEISDQFTLDLQIHEIMGLKLENETPDIPRELQEEYEQAMAEQGISSRPEDYESLTEEQKEIETKLFSKMYQKYYELYPEAGNPYSSYKYWSLPGDWNFTVDVTLNRDENVTKEINDIDENGLGIVSVTKTPIEIAFEAEYGSIVGLTVVLDADGRRMEWGNYMEEVAIQDRDVSRLDFYICEWTEYMDELKGYRNEENFKEILDQRALHHTEVVF